MTEETAKSPFLSGESFDELSVRRKAEPVATGAGALVSREAIAGDPVLHPYGCLGAIQGADHANTVIAAGRADLCCLARPHLADPYLTLHAASDYGFPDAPWPGQYLLGKPPKKA